MISVQLHGCIRFVTFHTDAKFTSVNRFNIINAVRIWSLKSIDLVDGDDLY